MLESRRKVASWHDPLENLGCPSCAGARKNKNISKLGLLDSRKFENSSGLGFSETLEEDENIPECSVSCFGTASSRHFQKLKFNLNSISVSGPKSVSDLSCICRELKEEKAGKERLWGEIDTKDEVVKQNVTQEKASTESVLQIPVLEKTVNGKSPLTFHTRKASLEFEKDLVRSMYKTIEKQQLPARFTKTWRDKDGVLRNRIMSGQLTFANPQTCASTDKSNGNGNGNGNDSIATGRRDVRQFVSEPNLVALRGDDWDFDVKEMQMMLSKVVREGGEAVANKTVKGPTFREFMHRKSSKVGDQELSESSRGGATEVGRGEGREEVRVGEGAGLKESWLAVEKLRGLSRTSRGNRLNLAELGAVRLLIAIINSSVDSNWRATAASRSSASGEETILEALVTVLLNLSLEAELKASIAEEGALPPLCHILKVFQDSAGTAPQHRMGTSEEDGPYETCESTTSNSLVESTIGLVSSLAAIRGNRDSIRMLGFTQLLMNFLGKSDISARAHHDATLGLVNLGLDEIGKDELVKVGCVGLLVNILERDDVKRQYADDAVLLLAELVKLPAARTQLIINGGIGAIASVVDDGSIRTKGFAIRILYLVAAGGREGMQMVAEENLLLSISLVADMLEIPFRATAQELVGLLRN